MLAWPVVISRSTQSVVGLCDALLVAPLGEASLAAVTAGSLNVFLALILPMGTVFIVGSFSAQFFGAGDANGARRFGWYGLVVAVAAQLLACAAMPFVDVLVAQFSYAPDVAPLMVSFLKIRLFSVGAAAGMEAMASYFGGIGNTRRPMIANVSAMSLNVLLNLLLIEGRFGFPRLGVSGSALASVIATTVAFLGLLFTFVREGRPTGLNRRELWRTVRFGLPSGFNWFFEFLAFNWFINVVVAGLGTTAVAAMMSVFQINTVSFMPAFGLASAGAILVGQAIGAKNLPDASKAFRRTLIAATIWQGLVGIIYLLIPHLLFRPFVKDGEGELLKIGASMLMISAAWQLFDATCNSVSECLRAAGDTTYPLIARLVVAWVFFVPGVWWSVRALELGPMGATVWVVLYLGMLSLVLGVRWRSGKWKQIELVASPVPVPQA